MVGLSLVCLSPLAHASPGSVSVPARPGSRQRAGGRGGPGDGLAEGQGGEASLVPHQESSDK